MVDCSGMVVVVVEGGKRIDGIVGGWQAVDRASLVGGFG
jgi:hypothetical protein